MPRLLSASLGTRLTGLLSLLRALLTELRPTRLRPSRLHLPTTRLLPLLLHTPHLPRLSGTCLSGAGLRLAWLWLACWWLGRLALLRRGRPLAAVLRCSRRSRVLWARLLWACLLRTRLLLPRPRTTRLRPTRLLAAGLLRSAVLWASRSCTGRRLLRGLVGPVLLWGRVLRSARWRGRRCRSR